MSPVATIKELKRVFILRLRLGSRGRSTNFVLILGIHGVGSAARGFGRNSMSGWEFVEELVGPGQVMRDHALGPDDLFHAFAWIRRDLAADFIEVVARADEGLGEIGRVARSPS